MDEPRKRGRPATGVTTKRNVRIGDVWDFVAADAEAAGETMTARVERLLQAEARRIRRRDRG